jgi:hypothetical protein
VLELEAQRAPLVVGQGVGHGCDAVTMKMTRCAPARSFCHGKAM